MVCNLYIFFQGNCVSTDTAQSSSDYILDTPAITFSAESTNTECADITIIDDEVLEEEETFTVTIDVITPGVTEGNTVTTFTIRDDEGWFL